MTTNAMSKSAGATAPQLLREQVKRAYIRLLDGRVAPIMDVSPADFCAWYKSKVVPLHMPACKQAEILADMKGMAKDLDLHARWYLLNELARRPSFRASKQELLVEVQP